MIKRGDVVYLKDEVAKVLRNRPLLVVSNDVGNRHSGIFLAVPLTMKHKKLGQPTHCVVGMPESMVMAEHIHTISQADVYRVADTLNSDDMTKVDECLIASLGLKGCRYDDREQ